MILVEVVKLIVNINRLLHTLRDLARKTRVENRRSLFTA
jgi:hypothetical protein